MPSITLTTDAAETARVLEAEGAKLGLGRDATVSEVKKYLMSVLAQDVHDYFRRKASDALPKPAPLVIT